MAYTLIVGYGSLAVVLAAWWQLRRSAHLLPYLRRGPSSFLFDPGYVFVSWIMAIGTWRALLTIRLRRWLVGRVAGQVAVENQSDDRDERHQQHGPIVRTAGVPDGRHARAAAVSAASESVSDVQELMSATMPIPVLTGFAATPRPRLQPPSQPMSQPSSEPESDPPTCPLPAVGVRPPGQPAALIGPPAGPMGGDSGYGSVEMSNLLPQDVVARRGAV